jgi:hypothetical protein
MVLKFMFQLWLHSFLCVINCFTLIIDSNKLLIIGNSANIVHVTVITSWHNVDNYE